MGTKIAHSNIINNLPEIAVPTILTRPPVSAASASAENTDDEFTEIEIGNNHVKNDDDKAVLPKQQPLGDVDPEQIPSPVAAASLTAAAEEKVNGEEEEEADFPPETPVDLGEKVGERERLLGVLFPNQDNLPKPQPPRGLFIIPSPDPFDADDVSKKHYSSPPSSPESLSSLGRYIRQRSNKISNAIARRLSLTDKNDDAVVSVTEFNLSGLKVIVQDKSTAASAPPPLKGRVTFFSRSNSRDCGAVRSFLRERGLNYAEINVDVFPSREKELVDRTGGSTVPQVFFNEKLIGGLAELNALRKGALDQTLREMLGCKCPDDAPAPPVYGFDDDDDVEERTDQMSAIVRVLRQKLPIQDRLIRMRIVKNCFTGTELVDFLTRHFDCHRSQAVQIGRELMRKHFIHHVFGEGQGFGDSSNFLYRFIEHEQYITKCYNFRGSTNDYEPKPASAIGQRLAKIMFFILESYASEDRTHVDYMAISNSEEFRRYLNLVHGLQRLDLSKLSPNEKLAFFLNLYNAMVIHAVIRIGYPEGMMERKSFVNDFQYLIGGHPYSLSAIKNGILRGNRRPPYSLVKPFSAGDKRLQVAFPSANPLIHFGLCDGARSSPRVRLFTSQNVEAELKAATRELLSAGAIEVDLAKQTVHLTSIIKWFSTDFGSEREILKWLLNYLDANKAGLVTHLLGDWAAVNISYQSYDWSLNS